MEDEQNKRLSRYNPIPAERKAEIIADALDRIEGETLEQIAQSHQITERTLWAWLESAPGYESKRSAIYFDRLRRAVDEHASIESDIRECIDSASKTSINEDGTEKVMVDYDLAQLRLARARALEAIKAAQVKAAQWELERRDKRYSAKQDVTVDQRQVSFVVVAPVEVKQDG